MLLPGLHVAPMPLEPFAAESAVVDFLAGRGGRRELLRLRKVVVGAAGGGGCGWALRCLLVLVLLLPELLSPTLIVLGKLGPHVPLVCLFLPAEILL